MKNEKIIYEEHSDTIRVMPQNYLLCHFGKCGHWICDPDSSVNANLVILTFKILACEGYRFRKHNEIINRIKRELDFLRNTANDKQVLDINKAKKFINQKKIIKAINTTAGWKNNEYNNIAYVFHEKLKNFLFDKAISRLPYAYRAKLLTKFCHPVYTYGGNCKAAVLEDMYLNSDFTLADNMKIIYVNRGRSVSPSVPMSAYWHAIDETVVAIADGKIDIQHLNKDVEYSIYAISEVDGTETVNFTNSEEEAKKMVEKFQQELKVGTYQNSTSLREIINFDFDTLG